MILNVRSTSHPHSLQHSADVLDISIWPLLNGKEGSNFERIFYLPSVHGELGEASAFFASQVDPVLRPRKLLPDVSSRVLVQIGIVQGKMDPAVEGLVDYVGAVGRHEQDSTVVFENSGTLSVNLNCQTLEGDEPEENRDDLIVVQLSVRSLLHKDITLVKQKDGVPLFSEFKNGIQTVLDITCVAT